MPSNSGTIIALIILEIFRALLRLPIKDREDILKRLNEAHKVNQQIQETK